MSGDADLPVGRYEFAKPSGIKGGIFPTLSNDKSAVLLCTLTVSRFVDYDGCTYVYAYEKLTRPCRGPPNISTRRLMVIHFLGLCL